MRLNPDATFDSLFVASHLQADVKICTLPEIHLFGYLACLLWLYDKRALTDWGYTFVGTELGAPYSQQIDIAVKELSIRGYLVRTHEQLHLTELAEEQLSELRQLELYKDRAKCLQAACASTAAFSVGMVRSAMANEPELSRAQALPMNRCLLENAAQSQLYTQFNALRQALDQQGTDLRLPAVVWLAALYRFNESPIVEA